MKANIQPLSDYVVAQTEEAATKTASGLYLPDKTAEKPQTAKVVAIGTRVKEVKVGDRIIHRSYGSPIRINGEEYLLVKEEDILATVK